MCVSVCDPGASGRMHSGVRGGGAENIGSGAYGQRFRFGGLCQSLYSRKYFCMQAVFRHALCVCVCVFAIWRRNRRRLGIGSEVTCVFVVVEKDFQTKFRIDNLLVRYLCE